VIGVDPSLAKKTFTRLGISIQLPKNTKEISKYTNQDYVEHYGCKGLYFTLMELSSSNKLSPDFESGPLVRGEVLIYDHQQELAYQKEKYNSEGYKAYVGDVNRRITKWDTVVKLDTPLTNRFGYRQKIYRLDHKDKASGKAFRASIIRASYANSPFINQADEELIDQILKSIRIE